jgi:hypothetical protein
VNKPVLKIEQLIVESLIISDLDASQDVQVGDVDTGCISDCATGCGFGGYNC